MACGWIFAYIIGNGRSTKVAKLIVIHWHLTFLRWGQVLYAFVWAPYICMEKMLIISNDFSSEASGPVLLKFHLEPPWAGEWKIAKMGMVHRSKWLPCPYMVKTFKNFLLHYQISPGPLFLHKLWGTGDLPKLLKWWFYVDIWPFYLQGQICFPMHLYGSYTFIFKVSKRLVDQQYRINPPIRRFVYKTGAVFGPFSGRILLLLNYKTG